ncbi:MAG: ubiquinone/menaquinone biosynthesis C-methylase UbiE [Sediminicola sp.]|jgi:ubiquinone/menaquinone biosynthesis C-methylase UbiE
MDYSDHMLSIARQKFPNGHFIQGDMRNFNLDKKIDAALITGRSTSYLLTSDDILSTFKCIYNVINTKGYLIFDCIDGNKFIPYIQKNRKVIHKSNVDHMEYIRTSEWYPNEKEPTIIHWKSSYYEQRCANNQFLGKETISFKVFTETEIRSALNKEGFEVMEIKDRLSYAFDTFVVIARKKK